MTDHDVDETMQSNLTMCRHLVRVLEWISSHVHCAVRYASGMNKTPTSIETVVGLGI